MFGKIRQENSLTLNLVLTDLGELKQSKFTDQQININKMLAQKILHRQKCLKEYFALQILEWFFLFNKRWLIQI